MSNISKATGCFIRFICIALIIVTLTIMPGYTPADAKTVIISRHYKTVVIKGKRYHYRKGKYYLKKPSDYVVVKPPRGTVVAVLPAGFATFVIGKTAYYRHSDIYYRKVPSGYVVVKKPNARFHR